MTATIEGIATGLGVLCEPGHIHEMRILGEDGRSGFYTDQSVMARDAFQASQDKSVKAVYLTLNAVQDDLLERSPNRLSRAATGMCAKDADIVRRRWILIDFDPVRPADCSATDAEKSTALELCQTVLVYLQENGFPEGLIADSGNGFHILLRVDLPAVDGGLVKRFLNMLADKFTTEFVDIDRKVFNASRICKLYGTMSRKGPDEPNRPHRASEILFTPKELKVVSKEQIEALIPQATPPRGNLERHGLDFSPSTSHRPADRQSILDRAAKWLAKRPGGISGQGGHDDTFDAVQFIVRGFDLSESESFTVLDPWNQSACIPPWSEAELLHKIRSARDSGTMEIGCKLKESRDSNWQAAKRLAASVEGVEGPTKYRLEVIPQDEFCRRNYLFPKVPGQRGAGRGSALHRWRSAEEHEDKSLRFGSWNLSCVWDPVLRSLRRSRGCPHNDPVG